MGEHPFKYDWQPVFIEALASTGNVTKSCKKANISRVFAYRCRKEDANFKAAWDDALDIAMGLLEDEAFRRAYDGWLEPVYYRGEKQGTIRKYSDSLLKFMLSAHKPFKYGNRVDVTSGNQPIRWIQGWTPDEWDDDGADDSGIESEEEGAAE